MQKKAPSFPAISRDTEFITRHVDEADDIWNGNVKVEPSIKRLADAVYERAEANVSELLNELRDDLDRGVNGLLRIEWHRYTKWSWHVFGQIYMPRGPKRRIGWAGLNVSTEGFRLIGWAYPRGGLDGRSELTRTSQKKMPDVSLASEDGARYPGWSGNNDAVVWLDEKLALKTSREELRTKVEKQAKQFFRIAKPLLKKLAGQK